MGTEFDHNETLDVVKTVQSGAYVQLVDKDELRQIRKELESVSDALES